MPKQAKPESFEVQGDKGYSQSSDVNALIAQITKDFQRETPNCAIVVTFQADEALFRVHCYEQYLDDRTRLEAVYEAVCDTMKQFVTHLKKEFSRLGGGKLKMTENKSLRDRFVNKVSLNGRFELVGRWVYQVEA